MNLIQAFTNEQLKTEVPVIRIGDTIRIHNKIVEGTKERIQLFEGTVIAKHGGGISETFTVRRVSYGVGVEKTFPLHSPNVAKVEVVRVGKIRRAKLYYLRDRMGKASKVKEKNRKRLPRRRHERTRARGHQPALPPKRVRFDPGPIWLRKNHSA